MKQLEGSSELQFVQQLLWAVLNNCTVDTISVAKRSGCACYITYGNKYVAAAMITIRRGCQRAICFARYQATMLTSMVAYIYAVRVSQADSFLTTVLNLRVTFANKSQVSHTDNIEELSRLVTMKIDYNPFMYHLYDSGLCSSLNTKQRH